MFNIDDIDVNKILVSKKEQNQVYKYILKSPVMCSQQLFVFP